MVNNDDKLEVRNRFVTYPGDVIVYPKPTSDANAEELKKQAVENGTKPALAEKIFVYKPTGV